MTNYLNEADKKELPTVHVNRELAKEAKKILKDKDLPILTGELPPEEEPRLARKGEIIKLHGLLYDVTFVNYNTGLVRIKLKKPKEE